MNTLEETVVVNQVERKAGRQSTLLKTLPAVVLGAGLLLSPMAFADGAKEGGTAAPAQTTEQSAGTKDADKAKIGNPEIEKLLNEEGIKFRRLKGGELTMEFETDGDRSQVVYIDPVIDTLRGYKTFSVYSLAYRGRVTKPMAMELLQPRYKVGFWRIQKIKGTEDTFLVAFHAQVPSTISARDLGTCLEKVALEADALERDWSDVDER